jgi:hypothetical protein
MKEVSLFKIKVIRKKHLEQISFWKNPDKEKPAWEFPVGTRIIGRYTDPTSFIETVLFEYKKSIYRRYWGTDLPTKEEVEQIFID